MGFAGVRRGEGHKLKAKGMLKVLFHPTWTKHAVNERNVMLNGGLKLAGGESSSSPYLPFFLAQQAVSCELYVFFIEMEELDGLCRLWGSKGLFFARDHCAAYGSLLEATWKAHQQRGWQLSA